MAAQAPTIVDPIGDPSRVIAGAFRPYGNRLRLARVVILVAYLSVIVVAEVLGDPPTWAVLGVSALAVIGATRGVRLLLPGDLRAILPRLRKIRRRQD